MLEAPLQKSILEYLAFLGIPYLRLNAGRVGGVRLAPAGWPDILAFASGRAFAIEVKGEGGVVGPEQEKVLTELSWEGVCIVVARKIEDVTEVVR